MCQRRGHAVTLPLHRAERWRHHLKDTAVITGTTHGIGLVTSLELARAGRSVVMLCRDRDAGYQVRDQIRTQVPNASLRVLQCDLASFASVRECAKNLRQLDRIDLLINNAGMVSATRRSSVDGFELTFA